MACSEQLMEYEGKIIHLTLTLRMASFEGKQTLDLGRKKQSYTLPSPVLNTIYTVLIVHLLIIHFYLLRDLQTKHRKGLLRRMKCELLLTV